MLGNVPVEVAAAGVRQRQRERGLADLARSGHEHHLPGEIPPDLCSKIAGPADHGVMVSVFLTSIENTNEYF